MAILALAVLFAPDASGAEGPSGPTGAIGSSGGVMPAFSNNGAAGYGWPTPGSSATPPAKPKKASKRQKKHSVKRRRRRTLLGSFDANSSRLFDDGRPLTIHFRLDGPSRRVPTRLIVRTLSGRALGSVNLGMRRSRIAQSYNFRGNEFGAMPQGGLEIKLSARDSHHHSVARKSDVPQWIEFSYFTHRFPLVGTWSFGELGARFGAPRAGHRHQGQDLLAADGTPIVAPHGGIVTTVSYQAAGAGHYVVVDGADEDRDYVFMHLQGGSTNVREGDVIPTGKLIGRVGHSGDAAGAHLHFEIWIGGHWFAGGKPIDPLPLLQRWARQGS